MEIPIIRQPLKVNVARLQAKDRERHWGPEDGAHNIRHSIIRLPEADFLSLRLTAPPPIESKSYDGYMLGCIKFLTIQATELRSASNSFP